MKKHLMSAVLMLLMIFSLKTRAHADEYCALGSYSAGEELHCYITMLPQDATVSAIGLPTEYDLVQQPGENGTHLSLRGRPLYAGNISFSLDVSGVGRINCSAEILPALPQVSISPDISCSINDSVLLTANAGISDGGSLLYQWYSGAGLVGTPIPGATDSRFSPDTSLPGRFGYFCEVTNVNNGHMAITQSETVFVTVAEPVITEIFINSLPAKLSYAPGEAPDSSGLTIKARFDNGTSGIISEGFSLSPAVFSQPGRQAVTVSYMGLSCLFHVDVALNESHVEGIGVLSLPEKTEYTVGERLDSRGLVIRAFIPGGQMDVSEGFECSPSRFTEAGRQIVTVSFADKSCSFSVTVKEDNTKTVDIASLPIRREYRVGDTLDTAGLSLRVVSGGKTQIISSGFSCSPMELKQAGTQTISVNYGEQSTSFTINVMEASATASPKPSSSPAPSLSPAPESESPPPSESALPSVNRPHQARDISATVKIIFIVAVIALAALAGYAIYIRKKMRR